MPDAFLTTKGIGSYSRGKFLLHIVRYQILNFIICYGLGFWQLKLNVPG